MWYGVATRPPHAESQARELACVERLFDSFYGDYDAAMYKVAQQVLRGEHAWMETGIISPLYDHADGAGLSQTQDSMRVPIGA